MSENEQVRPEAVAALEEPTSEVREQAVPVAVDVDAARAQAELREVRGRVDQAGRRGHVLEVMAWLWEHSPGHEPDEIKARQSGPTIEVLFHQSPDGVLAWAEKLQLGVPINRTSLELQQAIVEIVGVVKGWRVEIRHVHTAPATLARPTPDPVRHSSARGVAQVVTPEVVGE